MKHLGSSINQFMIQAEKQEDKGIKKYGQAVDPLDKDYDWLKMAVEEQVDGFIYLHAEQVKREYVSNQIRQIIKDNTNQTVHDQIVALLDKLEGLT